MASKIEHMPLEVTPDVSEVKCGAVLAADLEGFTRRMRRDEQGTMEFVEGCFELARRTCRGFSGRLIKTTGDGMILVFDDCAGAVRFSRELHLRVAKTQVGLKNPGQFRVGIHYGAYRQASGDIYGNTVNIASRLESEAQPGGSVISKAARDALEKEDAEELIFHALGTPSLKNVDEPVSVYRVIERRSEAIHPERLLRIETIGGLGLSFDDVPLQLPRSQKFRALLGYLSLRQGHSESVDQLAALLWPELLRRNSRRALTSGVRRAQTALQRGGFDVGWIKLHLEDHIGLDILKIGTDLEGMERALRRGHVPEVVRTQPDWPERVLFGYDSVNPTYAAWLRVQRDNWRNRILRALTQLIESTNPEFAAVADAADAVLMLEPGNELAAKARINNHLAHGNRSAALDEFDRLSDYLSKLYDMPPSEELSALVRKVRSDEADRQNGVSEPISNSSRRPPSRRALRLWIEEFEGNGPRPVTFRDDLIVNLTRFREWFIVEARDDANDYAIRGQIRPMEDGGKLSLSLVDLASDRLIWRQDLSMESSRWPDEQRLVIAKIAATIEVYISADRLARTVTGDAAEPTLHDEWLRGHKDFLKWTQSGAEDAQAVFRSILTQTPDYAPALASLAAIFNVQHIIWPGRKRDADGNHEALGYAERAVELDPMDDRNHRAAAWAAALNASFERAMIHLDLSTSLNPASAVSLSSGAMGFAWFGEREKSLSLLDRLIAISPSLPGWMWCYATPVYFFADKLDEALKSAEIAGDAILDNAGWKAATLSRLGRREDAVTAFQQLVSNVTPVWAGDDPISANAVRNWFVQAYPIRYPEDRARLADALSFASEL